MAINKLTTMKVAALVKAGVKARTADGGGLYLDVRAQDQAAWVLRYMHNGKSREMGIGSVRDVTLAMARELAASRRRERAAGDDPLDLKAAKKSEAEEAKQRAAAEAEKARITFRFAAEARMDAKLNELSNRKHQQQWRQTLSAYAYPHFGDKPVADITRQDVLEALLPIWVCKAETASRVRQRIEAVLDYAEAREWRVGANPADLRRLREALPSHRKIKKVRHHPALPWQMAGEFYQALARIDGMGALALRFAVLTASRSGPVRFATWSEIDMDADVTP